MTDFFHISIFFWIDPSFSHRTVTPGSDSARAPLQPVHESCPIFPLFTQKESPQLLCSHCNSLLCLPVLAQGCIPSADPTLPWTFSPCCPSRTALARQGAAWSWGKWSVHAGSCPTLTSHPSLSRFTPSLCLPKL